jgi:hypothetical protein
VCNICDAIKLYIWKYGKVPGDQHRGIGLPRKGYRTICVTDEVYQTIQKRAKDTNRTIPEYIKHLMEKDNPKKEKNNPT